MALGHMRLNTPAKKRRTVVAKPRKVNMEYYSPDLDHNWFGQTFPTQPKAAEAMSQASIVQIQQMFTLT